MQTKDETRRAAPHSLVVEQREKSRITGVEDVECFNEEIAVITTSMGAITVTGSGLKVAKLDLQAGCVELEGRVDSMEYGVVRKKGLLARLTR